MAWRLKVGNLQGTVEIQLARGAEATVEDLKREIYARNNAQPTYLQRLIFQGPDGGKVLKNDAKLSSYDGIENGSIINIVILPPFKLYVTGPDGRLHTLTVPSSEPENYPVSSLMDLVREKVHRNFTNYQLQFQNKPLNAVRHGKPLTLKDYKIRKEETLFIMKVGFTLDISNPKVDLCFLVDCTGSMASYIEAVKNNVKQLRDDLVTQYRGCDIRFAFVRYTDYDVSDRTTRLDFTNNQSTFHSFVSAIAATGGGDTPEDIMGGLKATFSNLSWRSGCSRILIHIADAPCHGQQYHSVGDNNPNGDRDGITHEQMMAEVCRNEVQYWFGYIRKDLTDKMIEIFNNCLQLISNQRFLIRQFDATKPLELGASVHRSVSSSIFGSEAAKKARLRSFKLDPAIPDWNSPAIIEKYGKKTTPLGIRSMRDLQHELAFDHPSLPITLKVAPHPFADGEEFLVYHSYDLSSKKAVVLKKYKQEAPEFNKLECYMKELEIRSICSTYAREFNADQQKQPGTARIDVHPANVVEFPGPECYLMESFLGGAMEKFSNNRGVVCSKSGLSELVQAFSHFSWVNSGRSLVICDLQGVEFGSRVTLIDPAIHSASACCYGNTDLGAAGIENFFKTHVCGDFCQRMGLSRQLP